MQGSQFQFLFFYSDVCKVAKVGFEILSLNMKNQPAFSHLTKANINNGDGEVAAAKQR